MTVTVRRHLNNELSTPQQRTFQLSTFRPSLLSLLPIMQASDALHHALQIDASCSRAFECLGAIAEREGRLAEAAAHYESAWTHESKTNAAVGYKLAIAWLRVGRPTAAIDVCTKILKEIPHYPRIRSEVLVRAFAMVRP